MNKITTWCKAIATLGPVGFSIAAGPLASFIAVGAAVTLLTFLTPVTYAIFVLIFCLFSYWCIHCALPLFNMQDPQEIVIDEVCGILCAFLFSDVCCLSEMLFLFLLFRFFDATKYGAIKYVERIPGSLGILLDDLVAALYARIAFELFLLFLARIA